MKKKTVTVKLPHGSYQMKLIQFIAVLDGKGGSEVLAICMDEVGAFDTYALDSLQGESFNAK